MSEKVYRAAAIGRTGGGNYGHGMHLAYKGLDNVEFIAVADHDEAGREKAGRETGAQRTYADYRDMLAKEDLDIVSVCPRWLDSRLEIALACIEAGCHIYCEKPFAMSLEEGDKIVSAAESAGVKIAVAHKGVYAPGIKKIEQMLEDGRIGELHAIHAHGKQDRRGGGEDMMCLGTHMFNMMRYFAGDVAWMSAHVTIDGREITLDDAHEAGEPIGLVAGDCINSYLAFKSGVSGFFDTRKDQTGGSGARYGMQIIGSDGIISLRGDSASNGAIYPYPVWPATDASHKWEKLDLSRHPLYSGNELVIIDLMDAVEHDREPICSGSDGVAAVEMALGAYESQLTGKRVALPLSNRKHPLQG